MAILWAKGKVIVHIRQEHWFSAVFFSSLALLGETRNTRDNAARQSWGSWLYLVQALCVSMTAVPTALATSQALPVLSIDLRAYHRDKQAGFLVGTGGIQVT